MVNRKSPKKKAKRDMGKIKSAYQMYRAKIREERAYRKAKKQIDKNRKKEAEAYYKLELHKARLHELKLKAKRKAKEEHRKSTKDKKPFKKTQTYKILKKAFNI